jgi:hypothetical protein
VTVKPSGVVTQKNSDRISKARESEKVVIRMFVERYSRIQKLDYKVVEWPDERKHASKHQPSIDAVAKAQDNPDLAIEHTHVWAVRGQIKEAVRFRSFRSSLEGRLGRGFPFYLQITLFDDHLYRGANADVNARLIWQWIESNAVGSLREGQISR